MNGMKQWDNTNRGVLFPNDKKGNEARPDHTGDLNVDGVEYRLSAWIKRSKKGDEFLSLSVQKKDGQQRSAPALKVKMVSEFTDDDLSQVPF
jgi:uncharacterized protein (DUF736 family)